MFIFQRKQVIGRNLENNNILYTKEDLLCAFKNDSLIFTNKDFFVSNVAIDSREVKNNDIFFAIKGERNDGHNFIQNAINNGAICIVCNHIPDKIESNIFNQNVNYSEFTKDKLINILDFVNSIGIDYIYILINQNNKSFVNIMQDMILVGFEFGKEYPLFTIDGHIYKALKMSINDIKQEIVQINLI